jgi:hypothetical protein
MEAYGNTLDSEGNPLGSGRRKKKTKRLEGAGYWKNLIRTELRNQIQAANDFLENYDLEPIPNRVSERFITRWTQMANSDIERVGTSWLRWFPLASRTTLGELDSTEPNPLNVGDRPEARRENALAKNRVVKNVQEQAATELLRTLGRVLRTNMTIQVPGEIRRRRITLAETQQAISEIRPRFLLPTPSRGILPLEEGASDTMTLEDINEGDDVIIIRTQAGIPMNIKMNTPSGWKTYRDYMDRQARIEESVNEAVRRHATADRVRDLEGGLVDTVERGIVSIIPAAAPVIAAPFIAAPVIAAPAAGEDAWDEEAAVPAGEQNAELAAILEGEGKPRRKKSKRV